LIKFIKLIELVSTHFYRNRKCVTKNNQEILNEITLSDLIQSLKYCDAERLSEFEHENIIK